MQRENCYIDMLNEYYNGVCGCQLFNQFWCLLNELLEIPLFKQMYINFQSNIYNVWLKINIFLLIFFLLNNNGKRTKKSNTYYKYITHESDKK